MRADYEVASLRKWFPLACGGVAWKRDGTITRPTRAPEPALVTLRIQAMEDKARFLRLGIDNPESKQIFLEKYRYCNLAFKNDYKDIMIDPWSENELKRQDIQNICKVRRANATILLYGLHGITGIIPVFTKLCEGDCPLFVPIFAERRDELQKWLAQRAIYCPVHWPKPIKEARSNLYAGELSLICDQRYGSEEMERILQALMDFYKR